MATKITTDFSAPQIIEVKESKTKRVWERTQALLFTGAEEGLVAGFSYGITGVIFGLPSLALSTFAIYYTQCKMLKSQLADLAKGKLGHTNFRTKQFIPMANTPANQLRTITKARFVKITTLMICFYVLSLFLAIPLGSGIYQSCNLFSSAVSNGRYKKVEKLIEMGFKPTQKLIDLAISKKHFGIAILLLDNLEGESKTSRENLVESYNNQAQEYREKRRQRITALFNKLHPEEMTDKEKITIERLRDGKFDQLNIHLGLKSLEAIKNAFEILNQETA